MIGASATAISLFSHGGLKDLLETGGLFAKMERGPHNRIDRAITSWLCFSLSGRASTMRKQDILPELPLPLFHRELKDFMRLVTERVVKRILEIEDDVWGDIKVSVLRYADYKTQVVQGGNESDKCEFSPDKEEVLANCCASHIVSILLKSCSDSCCLERKNSNYEWSAVLALYAALYQACMCRYMCPVSSSVAKSRGGTLTPKHTVPVFSERPFELFEWDCIPFRWVIEFLVNLSLCENSLALRILRDTVSMVLRVAPHLLLPKKRSRPVSSRASILLMSKAEDVNKDSIFNMAFNYCVKANSIDFSMSGTAEELNIVQMGLSPEEMSALAVLCCRNIILDEAHCDKLEGSVNVRNIDWTWLWEAIYRCHPAPQSIELECLNTLLEIDEYWQNNGYCKPIASKSIPSLQDFRYTNLLHSKRIISSNVPNDHLSVSDILRVSRVICPRILNYYKFSKEPISLIKLLSTVMIKRSIFARTLMFRLVCDQLTSCRILSRRAVWALTGSVGERPVSGQLSSCYDRAETMQNVFIDIQEVLAVRLLLEIASSCSFQDNKYIQDESVISIRELFEFNVSILPLLLFYYDDFITERFTAVLMRNNESMLKRFGELLSKVLKMIIYTGHLDENVANSPFKLIASIYEIKILSIGFLTWSMSLLNLIHLYFLEVDIELKSNIEGDRNILVEQCDDIYRMFGPFLMKCIFSFSEYHKPDLFLFILTRTFRVMVATRPSMALHPYLMITELFQIRANGTGYCAQNGALNQFALTHLESVSVAGSNTHYDIYRQVKLSLADTVVGLQHILHDGASGRLQSMITVDLIAEKESSRRKRSRSVDSTNSPVSDVFENASSGFSSSSSGMSDSGDSDDESSSLFDDSEDENSADNDVFSMEIDS